MASTRTRLAELSRTIETRELGRRIRNARIAAGMTQTDLAGDDVSSAYVSRIEDGQRRPGFDLLCRIAARLGTTLEALLEEDATPGRLERELTLDHAELALAGGDPHKALETVDALTAERGAQDPEDFRRRCQTVRAGALEATGDLSGAIRVLEELCASPTPTSGWLRCLIALSRCYRETGDLDRAIAVGEDAQGTIDELGLGGLTESLQLSVTIASSYLMRGDLDQAMRLCRTAIEDSERVQSPLAKASAYWNASLVEIRQGSSHVALDLARKALTYFEIGEDGRNLARLRGHIADIQLELDPPDPAGAIDTLRQAFAELEWSSGSAVDRASQLQTRARAHLILGKHDEALSDVEESLQLVPEEAAVERAYGHWVLGQVRMGRDDLEGAREAFRTAVQLLSGVGADREAAQLWFELGVRLRAVGETEAALDAFHRAGASTGLRATAPERVGSRQD